MKFPFPVEQLHKRPCDPLGTKRRGLIAINPHGSVGSLPVAPADGGFFPLVFGFHEVAIL